MNCPNCGAENMRTTETFKAPEETVRTKQCQVCKWRYTSRETISEDIVIPASVRDMKSKRKPVPLFLQRKSEPSSPYQTSATSEGQAETTIDGARSRQSTE
jgi:transcriptional regulator NrdR family protein